MRVYNTLTRQQEEFKPADGNKVRMYTCGPTVYNYAHVGNFRAYVFEDVLRRYLKFCGYQVTQVMNLTDIDDKTIKGSMEAGVRLDDYTQKYKEAFFEDLKVLNIEPAEFYPAATDHIADMQILIERLFDKGLAYKSEDGSVYFNVAKFAGYGKLAHLDSTGLRAGARVAQDEYDKENVGDFALWKAWNEADGDVGWDSPWGKGRPGWHIECSAMSMKYLGESFDLHTGGVDNIFPHHENEAAQSEGSTGKPFVKYWMHCGYLVVDGRKMAKSSGNFYTVRDVLNRGYTGREIRYVLTASHYRQSLNFTFGALDGARAALQRLDEFRERLEEADKMERRAAGEECEWLSNARHGFVEAMDNDLNVPEALAALFDMVHEGNRLLDRSEGFDAAGAALHLMGEFDSVLGFINSKDEGQIGDDVKQLLTERMQARQVKNWAESDVIREKLAELGWEVKDTSDGQKLRKLTK